MTFIRIHRKYLGDITERNLVHETVAWYVDLSELSFQIYAKLKLKGVTECEISRPFRKVAKII